MTAIAQKQLDYLMIFIKMFADSVSISEKQAFNYLDQLRFKKPNHQLCIRNQEIIDKYLHFTRSYIIKDQD